MPKKQTKIVYDVQGEKVGILLPIAEFDKLLDQLEDIDDYEYIKKYSKKRSTRFYPLEEVMAEIKSKP